MKVVFRVDASLQIGSGHVMRCLTLADALVEAGNQCTFIMRKQNGSLEALVEEKGYRVDTLPDLSDEFISTAEASKLSHAHWLKGGYQIDAAETQRILERLDCDWLVVDHYGIDKSWQQSLKPFYKKLLVIDDLADREHHCDLLLDQNLGRGEGDYSSLVAESCQLLTGPAYALLRPEFAEWRSYSLRWRSQQRSTIHVLINFGGVDVDNVTSEVLNVLADQSIPADLKLTVVMGPKAPWINEVRKTAARLSMETEVKVSVTNMAELMANADIAIGAAGSTSWERCALGLPTVLFVLAENQKQGARALAKAGAALPLLSVEDIKISLPTLLSEAVRRRLELSSDASKICDGKGTQRVVKQMLGELS